MNKRPYGITKDGTEISIYTIRNNIGMEASFLDFGANWVSMLVPDNRKELRDVVLGHDSLSAYEANGDMFGAFVGRVANRTEKGRFTLDGVEYQMEINDGENNLHTSSDKGFHKVFWDVVEHADNAITFSYHSPDGECGLPGNMDVQLTYSLSDDGELSIFARAICDKLSIINLTHHAYFNLNGIGSGDIMDTLLHINADFYTPVRQGGIPTGDIELVEGTPFDFRDLKEIGRDFFAGHEQQTIVGGGYDHNFVIRGEARKLHVAAEAYSEESGIRLTMYNDQPGVQLYTGNYIGPQIGKNGAKLDKYSGFCLETHGFTNAINTPGFPSSIIEADTPYETKVIYQFSVD